MRAWLVIVPVLSACGYSRGDLLSRAAARDSSMQVGQAGAPDSGNPPALTVPPASGLTLSGNGDRTCATAYGVVFCWQAGGALMPVIGVPDGAFEVGVGNRHVCTLDAQKNVSCWGENPWGQLGNGTLEAARLPTQTVRFGGAKDVAAGGESTCAIDASGEAWCWGQWRLGEGSAPKPERVGLTQQVVIRVGESHECALATNGAVACWGSNQSGQLGDGTTSSRAEPRPVLDLPAAVAALALGAAHSCALTVVGDVWCWGKNDSGQVTGSDGLPVLSPVKVQSGKRAIAAGAKRTCAIGADGIECWGAPTPSAVLSLGSPEAMALGGGCEICAREANVVRCAGCDGVSVRELDLVSAL